MNRGLCGLAVLAVGTASVLGSCHWKASEEGVGRLDNVATASDAPEVVETRPASELDRRELREVLAGMARSHGQKVQLAWWVSTPLRPVNPAFRHFYSNMGTVQGELKKLLQTWAKDHGVDLTYTFGSDTAGRAEKIMEARQEKLVKGDSQADFERDMLIQMYIDYEWQISLIEALATRVNDAELKAYLEKSLAVHKAGSGEIEGLLKGFRFNR